MVELKGVMHSIIQESNFCWNENLLKRCPNKINIKPLIDIRHLRQPLPEIKVNFEEVEYGTTTATYVFDKIYCDVYLDRAFDTIPEHIDSILKGIINEIICKIDNKTASKEEITIYNSIIEEISGTDNWMNDTNISNEVYRRALMNETTMRRVYIKAQDYKELRDLNLFLYLLHHESNHCASALLTWRRGTCNLNAWGEIWIDFCTFLELNDFFVINESEYDFPDNLNIHRSKQKHLTFAQNLIDRETRNGKSLNEILEAIWRYCFDKHIEVEEARDIISNALNIGIAQISKLEKKTKLEDVMNSFKF